MYYEYECLSICVLFVTHVNTVEWIRMNEFVAGVGADYGLEKHVGYFLSHGTAGVATQAEVNE